MSRNALVVVSLLAMFLLTLHLTDDFVNHGGTPPIGFFVSIAIVVTWLYAVLTLEGRRWGYIISAIGSFLGLFVVAFHTIPATAVNSAIAGASDPYIFVWVLFALGITSLYTLILALRGVIGKL